MREGRYLDFSVCEVSDRTGERIADGGWTWRSPGGGKNYDVAIVGSDGGPGCGLYGGPCRGSGRSVWSGMDRAL